MNGVVEYGSTMPERWIELVDVDIEKKKKIEEFNSTSADDFVDDMWNRMKKGG
jgi:hypothetical protein